MDDDDLRLTTAAEPGGIAPPFCWQISAAEAIDWREWGDEFVVRVASRAETHLLSPAAGGALLALLDGGSLTLDALYAKAFDVSDEGDAESPAPTAGERESLLAVLADFERLGIATRHSA